MITPKQRVAALLEHLQDSCSLDEIVFYLQNLARWDRAWAAEGARRVADIESGIDETIPAEKVLAEARANLAK